jgi:hypothetical protein
MGGPQHVVNGRGRPGRQRVPHEGAAHYPSSARPTSGARVRRAPSAPRHVMSTKAGHGGPELVRRSRVETSPCTRVPSLTRADTRFDGTSWTQPGRPRRTCPAPHLARLTRWSGTVPRQAFVPTRWAIANHRPPVLAFTDDSHRPPATCGGTDSMSVRFRPCVGPLPPSDHHSGHALTEFGVFFAFRCVLYSEGSSRSLRTTTKNAELRSTT